MREGEKKFSCLRKRHAVQFNHFSTVLMRTSFFKQAYVRFSSQVYSRKRVVHHSSQREYDIRKHGVQREHEQKFTVYFSSNIQQN